MLDRIEDTLDDQTSAERRDIVLRFDSLALKDITVSVEVGAVDSATSQPLTLRSSKVTDRDSTRDRDEFSSIQASLRLAELKSKSIKFGRTLKYKATAAYLQAYLGEVDRVRELSEEEIVGPENSRLAWRSVQAEALLHCEALDDALAIASSPDSMGDLRSCLVVANVHIKRNQFDLAKQAIEAALNIDFVDYAARLAAAALLLHEGDFLSALRSFRVAQEQRPTAFIPQIYAAVAYLKLGQNAPAIRLLSKIVNLHPLEDSALFLLSDVLLKEKNPASASHASRSILRFKTLFPSCVSEALEDRLAISLLFANETRPALQVLTEQYRRRADHVSTLNNLGVAALRLGRPRDANKFFEEAASKAAQRAGLSHSDLISYANFLGSLIQRGEADRALRFADTVLSTFRLDREIPQDVVPIMLRKLEALSDLERSDEAIGIVRKLLKESRPFSETWFRFALVFLYELAFEPDSENEVLETARIVLSNALEAHLLTKRLRLRAVNNAVVAMILADRVDEARGGLSYLSAFARSDPYAAATFGLFAIWSGNLSLGIERYDLATGLTEHKVLRARIRQRKNLEVGRAYLKRGDVPRAIRSLKKATETKDARVRVTREASRLLKQAQQHPTLPP